MYVSLAIATGFTDLRMRPHTDKVVTDYIPGVVANTEFAPGAYRILAPLIVHETAAVTGLSLQAAWYISRLLFILAAFWCVHLYLRTWFAPEQALAGVALTAATLPLTFTNSWPHPDSMPELALFTLGAMAVARRADALFAITLALAGSTGKRRRFSCCSTWSPSPSAVRTCGARGSSRGSGSSSMRACASSAASVITSTWQAGRNLADLGLLPANYDPYYRLYAYFAVFLFGPLLYLAIRARANDATPFFARRALLVVPCFVAVAFAFSSIIESRIFTPLYPLILPAAMFALFTPQRSARD